MNPQTLNPTLIEKVIRDPSVRVALTSQSHEWFFAIYFSHYITYPIAPFQQELFALSGDASIPLMVVVAFRGSGKSTIFTQSYPIWSILGEPRKKFVIIFSQTQEQARQHFKNLKRELETNRLLQKDLGPFQEDNEWNSASLVIPKYNARIMIASTEQAIRGIRHGQYRPDLIIADDLEDQDSTRTKEGRDKTYRWWTGEVMPLGDKSTKIVLVGNLLHEDSLVMRLKQGITEGKLDGAFREYPLITSDGQIAWLGKYSSMEDIERLRRSNPDESAWFREYLLRIISDTDRLIHPEWINFYDQLPMPTKQNEYINTFLGVDLAISEKTSADCTAVVVIHAYGNKTENRRYYVDKRFINKRLSFMQTVETIEQLAKGLQSGSEHPMILVENVGYQASVVEALDEKGLRVKGIPIKGDKHARLMASGMLFEQGRVFFPKTEGVKDIVQQLTGFGVEKHDDLVDATTLALNYIHTKVSYGILLAWIGGPDDDDDAIYTIHYKD